MKSTACLLFCLMLTGCAVSPPAIQEAEQVSLFNDALFAPPSQPPNADDIFTVSDDMQRFIDSDIARRIYTEGKVMAIVDSLYEKGKRKFNYDAAVTNNAAGVFASHSGNCLSYTIMTAAFAKKIGVPVQFHVVTFGEVWDRSNNLDFRIGHVNLTLGTPKSVSSGDTAQLVDFTGWTDAHDQLLDDVGEDVIVAMFLNNRAAEALAQGKLDDAYWWAREAAKRTPSFLASYNTLGVIYMHHNNMVQANRVFERVLEREPENLLAMSNQVIALKALGRLGEAQALSARLTEIQPFPPFYYFNLGVRAMEQHDYKTAKIEFTKEVNRASYNHQFHFWLALADYNLGDMDETQKQLVFAMENSPNDAQHDLYAAKLAYMKQKAGYKPN
jgi:Flp pilus assembly protein TadD